MRWRTSMADNDWYEDEGEEYYPAPYVVVEKGEMGIGPFLLGIALGAGAALLFAPRAGRRLVTVSRGARGVHRRGAGFRRRHERDGLRQVQGCARVRRGADRGDA